MAISISAPKVSRSFFTGTSASSRSCGVMNWFWLRAAAPSNGQILMALMPRVSISSRMIFSGSLLKSYL